MAPVEKIEVPLPEYIREAATIAALTVIKEHVKTCPINNLEKRVGVLERRFYLLVGAIFGSGLLGGATAGLIMRL